MMMKSVIWWRKPEYPEETTDLWQVTDKTFYTYDLCVTGNRNIRRVTFWGIKSRMKRIDFFFYKISDSA